MNSTTIYIVSLFLLMSVSAVALYVAHYYVKAKEIAPKLRELSLLQADINAGERYRSELKGSIRDLEGQLAEARQCIADADERKKFLDETQEKAEKLKRDQATAKKELEDVLNNLKPRIEEKQQLEQEIKASRSEYDRLEREISNANSILQGLSSDIEQKTAQQQALHTDIEKLKKQQTELNANVQAKLLEQQRLDSQIEELQRKREEKIKELEDEKHKKETDIANLKNDIESDRCEKARLEKEIERLRKIYAVESAPEVLEEHRWADLDQKPIFRPLPSSSAQIDEESWLKNFQANLKDAKIEFTERMIKAFHTSLKVEDYSPLVVLAGISGTGKSMLPELYAYAAGMNFLQVPVQPRWDSPQDLFGFFNYMEGRYKATPLSRLLWWSDSINNEKAVKGALNLVLLDEMNLARVEYYFSDLLSKLEVRRGIDTRKAEQRRAAEIEIDCGASKNAKALRRIFVGSNTLFVGTMNEDESTQTLSDKVMDRSNVLRFSSPSSLGVQSNKRDFMNKYANQGISLKQWKDWQKTDSSHDEEIKEILESLNRVMLPLGHSFGYRMYQSVCQYVAQYPGDKNAAIVDQLEMKILPKLSGLDLADGNNQSHLDEVRGILQGFHDAKLEEAFDAAKSHSFFQWKGVIHPDKHGIDG